MSRKIPDLRRAAVTTRRKESIPKKAAHCRLLRTSAASCVCETLLPAGGHQFPCGAFGAALFPKVCIPARHRAGSVFDAAEKPFGTLLSALSADRLHQEDGRDSHMLSGISCRSPLNRVMAACPPSHKMCGHRTLSLRSPSHYEVIKVSAGCRKV